MEPNKTERTAEAAAPEAPQTPQTPKSLPVRRVGSLTLGACLIAAGVFFLLYFFVPGFDVQLTLKIAPAVALVLLGCEVLFFAARPGRWKYDFVSVLGCLVLMAGCFCMAMLPMLWDELSGENQQTMNRLSAQAIDELYTACKRDAQDIAIREISGRLNLSGLAIAIDGLAAKARINKLMPDDIAGGTFTITNFGTFKSLFGTPIINQPQVAILGVGVIEKKPAVMETPEGDVIAIRHKMYLSLSYDHRVVDGSLGGNFLYFIKNYLENWNE